MIDRMLPRSLSFALALTAFAGAASAQTMEFACPAPGTTFVFDSGANIVARGQEGMDCKMEIVGGKPFKVRGLLFDNPAADGSDKSAFIEALKPERLWPLAIGKKIEVLADLGLGYLTLGQSSTTLSGGEAQRIKIATELSKLQRSKHTVYILDEPTTGLHLADIERLLESLNRLVDAGHTVLLIEHHLDVIKTADHVIDLGPEGGHAGGQVVVTGTPEDIAACKTSHTGRFLKAHLRR